MPSYIPLNLIESDTFNRRRLFVRLHFQQEHENMCISLLEEYDNYLKLKQLSLRGMEQSDIESDEYLFHFNTYAEMQSKLDCVFSNLKNVVKHAMYH
jgi:hypothetical protein